MATEQAAQANPQQGSLLARGASFIKESRAELSKVHTPSREETVQATWVTLVIMVIIALVLFVFDVIFRQLMEALIPAVS